MIPSQADLQEAFEYDPFSGIVKRKIGRSNMIKNSIVGCVNKSGYKIVTFNSKSYRLHRLIWIYVFGHIPENFYIDHINGNKIDNRLENLRLATNSQNQQNRPAPKNSTSGYRGITWHKQAKKWMARICCNKKRITIGFFDTAEQAYAAYKIEVKKLFSHSDRLP